MGCASTREVHGPVSICTYKQVEELLRAELSADPVENGDVRLGHFGAIKGKNDGGIVGRASWPQQPAPTAAAIENLAVSGNSDAIFVHCPPIGPRTSLGNMIAVAHSPFGARYFGNAASVRSASARTQTP